MQAALALEPLAWEAEGDGGAGGGADFAEGEVAGRPGFGGGGVGRKHRAADVIDADVVDHPALDHGKGLSIQPDIFADQRTGGFVVFGISDVRSRSGWGIDAQTKRQQLPGLLVTSTVLLLSGSTEKKMPVQRRSGIVERAQGPRVENGWRSAMSSL